MSLHVAYYNSNRVHETLEMTPAMAIRVTDHIWSLEELITTAMSIPRDPEKTPEPTTPAPTKKPPLSRASVEKRIHWRSRKNRPVLRPIQSELAAQA